MPDQDRWHSRVEQAGSFGDGDRLAGVLLERVCVAPARAAHAGQRKGDDPPALQQEWRDEAPPVRMRRESVQQQEPGLASFTPDEHLDFGALDLEMGSLRRLRERSVEPRRRNWPALDGRASGRSVTLLDARGVMIDGAELGLDHRCPLEVVTDGEFVGHAHAAVQLDGRLADELRRPCRSAPWLPKPPVCARAPGGRA